MDIMTRYTLALIALFLLFGSHGMAAETLSTDVFVSGQDGYDTYRIPSIIAAGDQTLLAFCEGRKASRSDAGDIDLVMKRSIDGGKTWGPQRVIWDEQQNTCGNPCPVLDRMTGDIHLLMTHNLGTDHESKIVDGTSEGTRTVWITSSRDHGLTWSPPREITDTTKKKNWSWYATGPGVGIQLEVGPYKDRLVIPCDHKTLGDEIGYYSHVIYSDDHAKTWHIGGITQDGANECQVVERTDGSLLLNMRRSRHNPAQHRAIATSRDGGVTWSNLDYDKTLIAPRCQASLLRLYPASDTKNPPVVLFSNPAHVSQRIRMTVRISEDDGKTWNAEHVLHEGPSAYSCLISGIGLPGGWRIGCLFEAGEESPYEKIVFHRF
jgi:sialidase-1